MSLVDPDADVAAEAAAYRPAFSHLALLEQIPGVDVLERVTAEKGAPLTPRELEVLDERRAAARAWLTSYAPERARLTVQRDALPAGRRGPRRRRSAPTSRSSRPALDAGDLGRRNGPGRHLRHREGARPAGRPRLRGDSTSRSSGRPLRAARRVAARGARPRLRDPAPARGGRAGVDGMSVGLQRLRDEPDLLRRATADKGEDPAVVERALELDERRRDLLGRRRRAQGRAQRRQPPASARPFAPAPIRTATRCRSSRRPRRASRSGSTAIDAELATVQADLDDAMLRIPNPADPDVPVGGEEANVTVRTWGEPAAARGPAPALGDRRAARPDRQRARRQGHRLRAPGLPRCRVEPAARPDQLVPGRPYPRERHDRGLAAGARQRRYRRAAPGRSRTRKTRCTSSRATTCT